MTLLLNAAQLVLYIALLSLLGQGVLHLLAGAQRERNAVYQLFQVLNRPWMGLARRLAPARLAGRHLGWQALAWTGLLYVCVTLARIAHCLSVAMAGCR